MIHLPPCVPHYELKGGFEWHDTTAPHRQNPVGKRERSKLKHRARQQGKIIMADWLADARVRMAEIGALIAADEIDQARRDRQEVERRAAQTEAAGRLADLADSARIADLLLEAAMPADQVRRQRRAVRRAIQREREKLAAEAKRLSKAKLLRLGKR